MRMDLELEALNHFLELFFQFLLFAIKMLLEFLEIRRNFLIYSGFNDFLFIVFDIFNEIGLDSRFIF